MALVALCSLLFWKGCQDETDPDWLALDEQLAHDFFTLDKAVDSLQILWRGTHEITEPTDDSLAFRLMAEPFLPTMEFEKFERFVQLLLERKSLLLSSVSGGGTSTLVDRLAKFMASSPQHILFHRCAPKFDIEYYRDFIGKEEDGAWRDGKLLKFLKKCAAKPNEKFVFVIDDFDKVNPETFFGPELWEKFNDDAHLIVFGKDTLNIPNNFHLIMVTHAGIGERVKLNDEHFRRLGNPVHINPSMAELICFLRSEKMKRARQLEQAEEGGERKLRASQVENLTDTANLKRFVYTVQKTNEFIAKKYGLNFRLGTWSHLRKLYRKEDSEKLLNTFIEHVNSLQPDEPMTVASIENVIHATQKNGKLKGTNPIMTTLNKMEEMGFLTEFVVGLSFLLLSGITSWYFFRKRQRFIKDYTDRIYYLIQEFELGKVNYDEASEEFVRVKKEVDNLVLEKKVNYTEATFFYNFIEDKIKRIEMARTVNKNFEDLVRVFMDDNVLSENEYRKLLSFLDEIKHKISLQDYNRFKQEVDDLYLKFRG